MKHALALIAALALFSTNSVCVAEVPNLDDPKVREKILKEAVLLDTLEERLGPHAGLRLYEVGKQFPFTGWAKNKFKQNQD